jgi:hypothetical protein
MLCYILDADGQPQPVTPIEWSTWFVAHAADCTIAVDQIDDVRISTVFIGLDPHAELGGAWLWETKVFGGVHDGWQINCDSREEALREHAELVAEINSEPAHDRGALT